MELEFDRLQTLLRRRADDVQVADLIGEGPSTIEREEHYGTVDFKDEGVDVVFKEAAWVIPPAEVSNSKTLYVSGFHFHREGHEGFHGYRGKFTGDVAFNDSETDVRRKLGEPSNTGGGGISNVTKKPAPRWLRYKLDHSLIHFQLDAEGKLEMVTLFVEEPWEKERERAR